MVEDGRQQDTPVFDEKLKGPAIRRQAGLVREPISGGRTLKTFRRAISLYMGMLVLPSLLLAAPTIPGVYGKIVPTLRTVSTSALPQLYTSPTTGQPGLIYGVGSISTVGNQMTIFQNQSSAIIDWSSFNIGSNASVYFNQQGNAGWAALNRIWDTSPSQIYGSLKADGKIYLINQNGILFGPGSQVNVHGLIASSLNLSVDNFLAGTMAFNNVQGTMKSLPSSALQGTFYTGETDPFYSSPPSIPGPVSNAGSIGPFNSADNEGFYFLIGPTVENSGTILAPYGQIGLAAGIDLQLQVLTTTGSTGVIEAVTYPGGESRSTYSVVFNNPSPGQGFIASNLESGQMAADMGVVGMYGSIVNNYGVIRAVTGIQRGGHVELQAIDSVYTAPGSIISLPVDSSSDAIISSSSMTSDVTLSGVVTFDAYGNPLNNSTGLIDHEGAISAPSAQIALNAAQRVYLGPASSIDVSGLWINESADAGALQIQLNSYQPERRLRAKRGSPPGADDHDELRSRVCHRRRVRRLQHSAHDPGSVAYRRRQYPDRCRVRGHHNEARGGHRFLRRRRVLCSGFFRNDQTRLREQSL